MAFRQRTVEGTVVDGDGSPIANAEVKFKPTELLAYTATHVIVDAAFTAQTDGDGNFEIDMWCDEDSLVAVNYRVYFPTEDGGSAQDDHTASFSLEYGDGSAVNLSALINASLPAPTPQELLYEFINQEIQTDALIPGELSWLGIPQVKEIERVNVTVPGLIVGTNDLYTCPAGKVAIVSVVIFANPTGGAISYTTYRKHSGTYYRLNTTVSAGANTSSASFSLINVVAAGDSFSISPTGSGGTAHLVVLLLPDDSGLMTKSLYSPALGQTTVYEVPAGKQAFVFPYNNNPGLIVGGGGFFSNDSGGARTHKVFYVPAGEAVGSAYQLQNSVVNNGSQFTTSFLPSRMAEGDQIIFETDSASGPQFFVINVFEADA